MERTFKKWFLSIQNPVTLIKWSAGFFVLPVPKKITLFLIDLNFINLWTRGPSEAQNHAGRISAEMAIGLCLPLEELSKHHGNYV